jgi:hypothetical protein
MGRSSWYKYESLLRSFIRSCWLGLRTVSLVFERRANGREISVRTGSGMLVDEGFAGEEKGSETGRDDRGKTSLRDLKFGGKGLDKNSGDEEGENMRERESGTFVASVPLESPGDAPFELLVLEKFESSQ